MEIIRMDSLSQFDESVDYFSEAVFADGKESVADVLEAIKTVKQQLEDKIVEVGKEYKKFNPEKYWRSMDWKKLEDVLMKTFGFRYCEINPYVEKYLGKDVFESKELQCCVYRADRYPIDGLVTDKGYYDKTHSSVMTIFVSLGLIHLLEPEEILAVLLHEFGHSIDPALATITFTEVNVLSKYITDRKGSISDKEKKALSKSKSKMSGLGFAAMSALAKINGIVASFGIFDKLFKNANMKKLKKAIEEDNKLFKRQEFTEAFADNFARMYGYGSQLGKALHKMSKSMEKDINSYFKRERAREKFITDMTIGALNDVHKTDVHRVRNLIREYKNDLNDPNIPAKVKEHIKSDMEELEKVLNMYLNNFSDFQNNVNKMINEEIDKLEKKEPSPKYESAYTEGADISSMSRAELEKEEKRLRGISGKYDELKLKSMSGSTSEDRRKAKREAEQFKDEHADDLLRYKEVVSAIAAKINEKESQQKSDEHKQMMKDLEKKHDTQMDFALRSATGYIGDEPLYPNKK